MAGPTESIPAFINQARKALTDGQELPADLRRPIRYSWLRSKLFAVPIDRFSVPYIGVDDVNERFLRLAEPILDRFAEQLADTPVSIVLADRQGRVVGRWAGDRSALRRLSALSIEEGFVLAEDVAGTNGIGTVLEERAPVTIIGGEHYAEPLQPLTCVGVPIRHPLSRRLEGVLDLACPTVESNNLLMPTAMNLGMQLEKELSAGTSEPERVVFDEFVARSKQTSVPLVALSERYMFTNAPAANLLEQHDQTLLWEQAAESIGAQQSVERVFQLSNCQTVWARCTPIRIGSVTAGALLEILPQTSASPTIPSAPVAPAALAAGHASAELEERVRMAVDGAVRWIHLVGEPGVGKLSLARRIHLRRDRHEPIIVLPSESSQAGDTRRWRDKLTAAFAERPGTIVVTHVESLDTAALAVLLETLRTRTSSSMVITAASVPCGSDRSRVAIPAELTIEVPALRERKDDIPQLVYACLRHSGYPDSKVGHRAMAALVAFPWPNNLTQLNSVVAAAAELAGEVIEPHHLPDELRETPRLRGKLTRLERIEKEAIAQALREQDGNKVQAAEILGMSRSTLYRRLRRYGLDSDRSLL